jgi:glycosyltransferase involved in cell wall biosynthesis
MSKEISPNNKKLKKILIHHHFIAYQDKNGIWINSILGKWIIELANYFHTIGLLVHVSKEKSILQDICMTNNNIVLHSLGPPGYMYDKFSRSIRIRKVCNELANKYDSLIIRGITPRQYIVYKNIEVTEHKYFLLVCSLNKVYSINRIKSFFDLYSYFMERHRLLQLKLILKKSSLLVNSPKLKKEAKKILKVKADFIPTNTISSNEFSSFKVRKINKPLKLLFCGRIEFKKGIIEAIKAIHLLKTKDIEVKLYLIGSFVDGKFEKETELLINKLNINDKIIFLGRIPYGKILLDHYKKSDIFILPSYTEGFPHVLWEAAGNCCPIITTNVGGIPTYLKHNYHGILIPSKNYIILADSIIKLINNEKLRSKIITNAYELAKMYTVENCAKILSDKIS